MMAARRLEKQQSTTWQELAAGLHQSADNDCFCSMPPVWTMTRHTRCNSALMHDVSPSWCLYNLQFAVFIN